MKLQSGRRIFDKEICARRVTYNFLCKAKSGEELIVEVGERGEVNLQSPKKLIGALNWHFPKREWDARLSVASCGSTSNKYCDEVKGIAASLQIVPSADGKTFGLFTKTVTTELRIRSIMLYRESSHRSSEMYPDNVLHVREVQDLGVWQLAGKPLEYHASARSQPEMVKDRKLWWEVSVSSITANAILQENEKMEIGDLTKWKPIDIVSKGVVKDLSSVAKDLVTRIDTVGYFNKGPKAGTGTRPSILKDAGYW